MGSRKIAIFYETAEGHTRSVAERMRDTLAEAGHDARVVRCRDAAPGDIDEADAVIVGS